MNIAEIIDKITSESSTPGRFPARLIFARNFSDYASLLGELQGACDEVIDLADFTKGDLLPRFGDFVNEIDKYPNKQLLLLSLGEYLRLCIKLERDKSKAQFPRIWERIQRVDSTTKYIIPIFAGREVFDSIVPFPDERQKEFIWELDGSSAETEYTVTIYKSPDFLNVISPDAANLHEWLKNWTSLFGDRSRTSFTLLTKLYHYAERTSGGVSLRIVGEPFTYVVSLVSDGEKLKKTDGSDEFWKYIAQNVQQNKPFAETIKHILNIGRSFDPKSVLARFNDLSHDDRNLLVLWYKLYPSDDYYTLAIGKVAAPAEIPASLRDTIFDLPAPTDSFVRKRVAALKVLDVSYSNEYFSKLDKIPAPESRLAMLTYKTSVERAYAVKTVSLMLRSGGDSNAVAELFRKDYPALAEYLGPENDGKDEIAMYFNWYRRSKLINRPNTDPPCPLDFDCYDSRNKVIQQYASADSLQFWVDGLGAEWTPVLLSRLNSIGIGVSVKLAIARAIAPTETDFNRQWTSEDVKWDRLDKLSHSGVPDDKDYFLCIARQLEVMDEIAMHVGEMLTKVNTVIITGDHGSSRLAALLFHDSGNFAVEPPPNAIVRSFGRFAELLDDGDVPLTTSMERTEFKGKHYVVMKTYEHFRQSGNAAGGNSDSHAVAGEVHGGMTPEEYLVPVFVVSRKTPIPAKEAPKKPKGIAFNPQQGLP